MGSSSLVALIGTGTIRIAAEVAGRSGFDGWARRSIPPVHNHATSAMTGNSREIANERGIRSLMSRE